MYAWPYYIAPIISIYFSAMLEDIYQQRFRIWYHIRSYIRWVWSSMLRGVPLHPVCLLLFSILHYICLCIVVYHVHSDMMWQTGMITSLTKLSQSLTHYCIFFTTVKLPQILKIIAGKSGAGLSMPSIYLELAAITASCAYGFAAQYPFRLVFIILCCYMVYRYVCIMWLWLYI